METQTSIDTANSSWWNEVCGSSAAKAWGITDDSAESLARYDQNYLTYYPYLEKHIPWNELKGKRVLEIGLGYGTVAQKLAASGADYTGLDIAANPVAMVNHRLHQIGSAGRAVEGNILHPPFEPESFDAIIAIGCLHHTGNLAAAIESCRDLLRPNGMFIGMVYYAYSYRQWWNEPAKTFKLFAKELFGKSITTASEKTSAFDYNSDGSLAPSTEFISIRSLRKLCKDFRSFKAYPENANQEKPLYRWTREQLLNTPLPRFLGLDLYWICIK